MLSLIHDSWLPVWYSTDNTLQIRKIRPAELVDEHVVDLAFPRADFQGAGYQFLIGLLQAAVAPEDGDEWEAVWDEGLNADELAQALAELAPAFVLRAEKPSFMQDFSALESEPQPISGLLIDAPGGNTLKLNKDHFVKRGTVQCICPACAAMALFTLQINAPSGGQGHRVSLRGGGPMTSLVWPLQPEQPLWRTLWLNVLNQARMPVTSGCAAERFPWYGPTRTSEKKNGITTPELAHPQQAYWSMPRRVELDFSAPQSGQCDLCGEHSTQLLHQYRAKNYGVQYEGWRHPLTPYRQDLKDPSAPLLSVKGQPGGLLYKDWLGLIWRQQIDGKRQDLPAEVVLQAHQMCPEPVGLRCFGYDMDNMKARCWYEHQLPLPTLAPEALQRLLAYLHQAVSAAQDGVVELRSAVKEAWYKSPKEAKGDFSFIDLAFWQETEPEFSALLAQLQQQVSLPQADLTPIHQWARYLREQLMARFDRTIFSGTALPPQTARALTARKNLYLRLRKNLSIQALNPLVQPSSQRSTQEFVHDPAKKET